MNKESKKFCEDCGLPSIYHIQTWLDCFLPPITLPRKLELFFDVLIEKFFTFSRLASFKDNFTRSDIQLRSACFIEELKKRGAKIEALRGPFGYTNYFRAKINNKVIRFEGLPIANFVSKYDARFVDDKEKTKLHLQKGGFPIAEGKSFWFWQKKKAVKFGKNLDYPLVVKPRSGSVSRHVTTDIQDSDKLKMAIHKAVIYSPVFIIEKFLFDTAVHRATVIDFDFVACVKQAPANIVGNGISTIRQLIDQKNNAPGRGGANPYQKEYTLHKIVEDQVTEKLLDKKGHSFSSIPKKGEIVFLQKDPFLKLGGDLVEMTSEVHPDNLALFKQVARHFDIRVVGIDFLIRDISLSWKKQQCAILELNSLPCIEMHHFPSFGKPQNVGEKMVDLFFKYYL